jgi:hypothetical protein
VQKVGGAALGALYRKGHQHVSSNWYLTSQTDMVDSRPPMSTLYILQ